MKKLATKNLAKNKNESQLSGRSSQYESKSKLVGGALNSQRERQYLPGVQQNWAEVAGRGHSMQSACDLVEALMRKVNKSVDIMEADKLRKPAAIHMTLETQIKLSNVNVAKPDARVADDKHLDVEGAEEPVQPSKDPFHQTRKIKQRESLFIDHVGFQSQGSQSPRSASKSRKGSLMSQMVGSPIYMRAASSKAGDKKESTKKKKKEKNADLHFYKLDEKDPPTYDDTLTEQDMRRIRLQLKRRLEKRDAVNQERLKEELAAKKLNASRTNQEKALNPNKPVKFTFDHNGSVLSHKRVDPDKFPSMMPENMKTLIDPNAIVTKPIPRQVRKEFEKKIARRSSVVTPAAADNAPTNSTIISDKAATGPSGDPASIGDALKSQGVEKTVLDNKVDQIQQETLTEATLPKPVVKETNTDTTNIGDQGSTVMAEDRKSIGNAAQQTDTAMSRSATINTAATKFQIKDQEKSELTQKNHESQNDSVLEISKHFNAARGVTYKNAEGIVEQKGLDFTGTLNQMFSARQSSATKTETVSPIQGNRRVTLANSKSKQPSRASGFVNQKDQGNAEAEHYSTGGRRDSLTINAKCVDITEPDGMSSRQCSPFATSADIKKKLRLRFASRERIKTGRDQDGVPFLAQDLLVDEGLGQNDQYRTFGSSFIGGDFPKSTSYLNDTVVGNQKSFQRSRQQSRINTQFNTIEGTQTQPKGFGAKRISQIIDPHDVPLSSAQTRRRTISSTYHEGTAADTNTISSPIHPFRGSMASRMMTQRAGQTSYGRTGGEAAFATLTQFDNQIVRPSTNSGGRTFSLFSSQKNESVIRGVRNYKAQDGKIDTNSDLLQAKLANVQEILKNRTNKSSSHIQASIRNRPSRRNLNISKSKNDMLGAKTRPMILGVSQLKNPGISALSPARFASIPGAQGGTVKLSDLHAQFNMKQSQYEESPTKQQDGGYISLNQIIDRRTIQSSHVGTRKRAAMMGHLKRIEKDETILAVNL